MGMPEGSIQFSVHVFIILGYGMVFGMDWLHNCGKMWIDRPKKSMCFRLNGQCITLRGIKNKVSSCEPIFATELNLLIKQRALAQLVCLCPVAKKKNDSSIPVKIEDVLHQ
jgi:hypothetical protein